MEGYTEKYKKARSKPKNFVKQVIIILIEFVNVNDILLYALQYNAAISVSVNGTPLATKNIFYLYVRF